MSIRDHQNRAKGKKPKFVRMPSPDGFRMGTKIHQAKEEEPEIICGKCYVCGRWIEAEDGYFEDNEFICTECAERT